MEATFGTYGWWAGPRPPEDLPGLAQTAGDVRPGNGWRPARSSLSRGIAHDPVHNATLGPKGHVPFEFLAFGQVSAGEAVRFRTTVALPETAEFHLALGAGAAKRAWINGQPLEDGPAGYLWLAPVTLQAGPNVLEWELTAEEAVNLRAAWALARDPGRFRLPEWLTPTDPTRACSFARRSTCPSSPRRPCCTWAPPFPAGCS